MPCHCYWSLRGLSDSMLFNILTCQTVRQTCVSRLAAWYQCLCCGHRLRVIWSCPLWSLWAKGSHKDQVAINLSVNPAHQELHVYNALRHSWRKHHEAKDESQRETAQWTEEVEKACTDWEVTERKRGFTPCPLRKSRGLSNEVSIWSAQQLIPPIIF